ncbi:hypothetical protein V6Z12_D09G202300, partial [Gossypium hirsutum]
IFFDVSVHSCKKLKSFLINFCSLSRLQINFEKSKLFLSPTTKVHARKWFSDILNAKKVGSPRKDLGLKMGKILKKREFFGNLLEKLNSKLAFWKSKFLSFGGRMTLIKSILSSIPLYPHSVFKSPLSICDDMDKRIRSLWWGHDTGERKLHTCN